MTIISASREALYGPMETFSGVTKELLERDSGSLTYAEQLNQRAFQLERELRAIRTRQNAIVTVNRLPTELLANIFLTLASETPVAPQGEKEAFLDESHPRLSILEGHRTRLCSIVNAPLDVEIDSISGLVVGFEDVICEALSQTRRLRTLILKGFAGHIPQVHRALSQVTGDAPILKILALASVKYFPIVLPPDFLSSGTPALERLDLTSVNMSWTALPLPVGLKILQLKDAIARPNPVLFCESLKGLPCLEELRLVQYLPSDEFHNISRFPLPSLKTLEVMDSCATICGFLDDIEVPRASHVVKSTVHGATKPLSGMTHFSLRALERSPVFQMMWYPPTRKTHGVDGSDRLGLKIRIHIQTRLVALPHVITPLNTLFDLTTVAQLSLEDMCYFPGMATVAEIFARFPMTATLSVNSCPIGDLLSQMKSDPALTSKKKKGQGPRPSTPFFPALTAIAFRSIDFEEETPVDRTLNAIIHVIKKRPKTHPIKMLEVQNCRSFSPASFDKVKKALSKVNVVWDGWRSGRATATATIVKTRIVLMTLRTPMMMDFLTRCSGWDSFEAGYAILS
ncbi:hypothetical protein NMY22_g11802 [Coprinellus aureogranulatus]|nr:hypothetical protein NMY22_g11802 [Coprinellus aureogranulatus]